jgi:hypothetical protein
MLKRVLDLAGGQRQRVAEHDHVGAHVRGVADRGGVLRRGDELAGGTDADRHDLALLNHAAAAERHRRFA